MKVISISYGYDIHSIELDDSVFEQVKSGKLVEVRGQGFSHEEDGSVSDYWVFNKTPGEIMFYLEHGAEFFAEETVSDMSLAE